MKKSKSTYKFTKNIQYLNDTYICFNYKPRGSEICKQILKLKV